MNVRTKLSWVSPALLIGIGFVVGSLNSSPQSIAQKPAANSDFVIVPGRLNSMSGNEFYHYLVHADGTATMVSVKKEGLVAPGHQDELQLKHSFRSSPTDIRLDGDVDVRLSGNVRTN